MIKQTIPFIASLAVALTPISSFAEGDLKSGKFWWPDQLDLTPLRDQNPTSNPYGDDFNYAQAFESLDLQAVKQDIKQVLTQSQDWWPADWGNYGPFFIRMAWHSAGVYRIYDGRGGASGGQQRFDPLNSWPDNANLDKARRLLWPIKQKYGRSISWGDLMVLTGNVAMESMGFKTLGFGGGREDDWEPEQVNWGEETAFLANDKRYSKDGQLKKPMAAVQMGLIYVNPEGPNGNPDPLASAQNIRVAFNRMAMNDEEIVALIAGGHSFGKAHGAHDPKDCVGAEPAAAAVEEQGFGWKNSCGKGNAGDTVTSGLEGAWTITPTAWSINYLQNLFNFEWVKTKSPAGATQWEPKNADELKFIVDAHDPAKRHAPMMFTTDMALKMDPEFNAISKRFLATPELFDQAFARAWFKLTHRDMGPRARYLGSDVPEEQFIWQDPLPKAEAPLIDQQAVAQLKGEILESGLTVPELVRTAWASAASFRGTDMRGGANGARIRLAPEKDWPVNNPQELAKVLKVLEGIQQQFNTASASQQVSLADVIVLGGAAAIEKAAADAGVKLHVPFKPGRVDALQAQTDADSFAVLEPKADPFRNYYQRDNLRSPTEMMVERADYLNLTVPEMTVLIGGMRALNANTDGSQNGVFTDRPGTLSNDFFVNLLDMSNKWAKSANDPSLYNGLDRKTGEQKWTATPVDLAFGSNAELRAIAEVYASNDAQQKFVHDFVVAWSKVMTNDRFDLK